MPKNHKHRKVHADEKGHYVWENYFVRGKQKRTKRRVTVIDGEVVEDMDAWLLANADDIFLHQAERWDLIEQRRLDDGETQTHEPTMKPPPNKLQIDIVELESAFESLAGIDPALADGPCVVFLDLTTGKTVMPEDEEEVDEMLENIKLLELPDYLFEDLHHGELGEFVDSLPEGPSRAELTRVIRGKGAFRRFKDIVLGGGNVELKHRWEWFGVRRRRESIVAWLRDVNIEPDWGRDIFETPPLPDKRAELLRAVLVFVKDIRHLHGVRRIALLGSLTTSKAIPKDVDLLVEVADGMPLDTLARISRQLLGKTMKTGDGCGTDVFICSPLREYLGRVCSWKACAPGIRKSCQAQHCGRRAYLSDDLQNVNLDSSLIAEPPLELWPEIIARAELPDDVREELVARL